MKDSSQAITHFSAAIAGLFYNGMVDNRRSNTSNNGWLEDEFEKSHWYYRG